VTAWAPIIIVEYDCAAPAPDFTGPARAPAPSGWVAWAGGGVGLGRAIWAPARYLWMLVGLIQPAPSSSSANRRAACVGKGVGEGDALRRCAVRCAVWGVRWY